MTEAGPAGPLPETGAQPYQGCSRLIGLAKATGRRPAAGRADLARGELRMLPVRVLRIGSLFENIACDREVVAVEAGEPGRIHPDAAKGAAD